MTHFIGPTWDPPVSLEVGGKTYQKMLDAYKDPETASYFDGSSVIPYAGDRWMFNDLYTEGRDIYQRAAFFRDDDGQAGSPGNFSSWPEGDAPSAMTNRYYAFNVHWPRYTVDELLLVVPMAGSLGWDDGVTFWRELVFTDTGSLFSDPIARPYPFQLSEEWEALSGPCVEILRGGDNNWFGGTPGGGWMPENNPMPVTNPATDADLEWEWTIPPAPIPIQRKPGNVNEAIGRYSWTYADASHYSPLVCVPVKVDPQQNWDFIQFTVFQYAAYDQLATYDPSAPEAISNHIPYIYYLPKSSSSSVPGTISSGNARSGARRPRKRFAQGTRRT